MSTDKSISDKSMFDLPQRPLSETEAAEVKGGAAPISGPSTTPPPIVKKPITPRALDPCW